MSDRRPKLKFDVLEERALPSWAGTPPTIIAPPDTAGKVAITSSKPVKFASAAITKNEVDYFTFVAPTTGSYNFEATTPKSDMDTVLGVFDTFGNRVAFNNDFGGGTESSVNFSLLAGQKIFFGITNHTDTPGGKYRWQVTAPGPDDKFEENDSIGKAKNLGNIKTNKVIADLKMLDLTDFFKFSFKGQADATSEVQIDFNNSLGDLELRLFDRLGNLVRASTGNTNSEVISLDGFFGSTFYIQVYGNTFATNPDYDLTLNVAATPVAKASRTLYLNFDGATITRSKLESIGAGWGDPSMVDYFDFDGNGIQIDPLLNGRGDREQIIKRMLYHLNQDLSQFGVTAKRHFGSAVEGKNATTIFLGPSSLTGGYHIAGDIDIGNGNPTDIAFVGNEDWGSAEDTALALADVTLHEAGHTWGLWHVSSGTDLESMGLRYNQPNQNLWLANTSFLNATYAQYSNHGPSSINTFQTMHNVFGYGFASPPANVTVDTSVDGIFAISTSGRNDVIETERLESGLVEVRINGRVYRIGEGLREIRIYTQGDSRVTVTVLGDLGEVDLNIDRSETSMLNNAKIDESKRDYWLTGNMAHFDAAGDCGYPR